MIPFKIYSPFINFKAQKMKPARVRFYIGEKNESPLFLFFYLFGSILETLIGSILNSLAFYASLWGPWIIISTILAGRQATTAAAAAAPGPRCWVSSERDTSEKTDKATRFLIGGVVVLAIWIQRSSLIIKVLVRGPTHSKCYKLEETYFKKRSGRTKAFCRPSDSDALMIGSFPLVSKYSSVFFNELLEK